MTPDDTSTEGRTLSRALSGAAQALAAILRADHPEHHWTVTVHGGHAFRKRHTRATTTRAREDGENVWLRTD